MQLTVRAEVLLRADCVETYLKSDFSLKPCLRYMVFEFAFIFFLNSIILFYNTACIDDK